MLVRPSPTNTCDTDLTRVHNKLRTHFPEVQQKSIVYVCYSIADSTRKRSKADSERVQSEPSEYIVGQTRQIFLPHIIFHRKQNRRAKDDNTEVKPTSSTESTHPW